MAQRFQSQMKKASIMQYDAMKSVPIVAVTPTRCHTHGSKPSQKVAMSNLSKPIDFDELDKVLMRYVA
jgi:hypothetical protein